ncbi:hypothetical protein F5051DRAFT_16247 [Lentinula edodes]|nr:hypothetical protein F5051DRAFT_16247 [Lentinula edodes]
MSRLSLILPVFLFVLPLWLDGTTHAAPRRFQEVSQAELDAFHRHEVLGDRDRLWVKDFYGQDLSEKDKQAFKEPLTDVKLGKILTPEVDSGSFNKGLYTLAADYKGHDASDVVVKFLLGPAKEEAWGEVKALKDVGYFIDSGLINDQLAILMTKINGTPIKDTQVWFKANRSKRERLLNQMKPLVKDEIVNWACTKRLLHADLRLANIHVTFNNDKTINSSKVLDFGYPGVYRVSRFATRSMIEKWFDLQWENRQNFRAKLA